MPWMTLPRIGMHMDALLTQQHGMVAWLEHTRAEVRCTLFFHLAPLSSFILSSPLFLFSLVSRCTSSTTLLPRPRFFPLVSSPCLASKPILLQRVPLPDCDPHHSLTWCAAFPLLSLSFLATPTHQQAAFGCEASPTWIAGMLAAAPEEDPVTKEQVAPPSNTSVFLMSVRT